MIKLHQLFPRLAAGAFILSSGLDKRSVDDEHAAMLHGQAAAAYPFLADWEPARFVRTLSNTEIALGVALIVPFIPTALVSLALGVFSGGLVGLYVKTPGATRDGSVRPSPQGIGLAKDTWLVGIAAGLFVDSVSRGKL
ncbi:hypothetical protein ACFT5B_03695 [Luteimicrobium sp. NPDC057192]|uniref:hypothetical protein n=1 Tax=Luteimicrobium sp. NPDC057192 TaxID=3346042 RepID=UPI003641402D